MHILLSSLGQLRTQRLSWTPPPPPPRVDQVKFALVLSLPWEDAGRRICRWWERLLRAGESLKVPPQHGEDMFLEVLAVVPTLLQGTPLRL